jgi:hypothetical protein
MPAFTGDLASFFDQAPLVTSTDRFGTDEVGFDVTVRHVDKAVLERITQAATVEEWKRGQKHVRTDVPKWREHFARECVVGWDGLTLGVVARLTNRAVDADSAATVLPFDLKTAVRLMGHLSTVRGDETVTFEGWLLERAQSLASAKAAEAADVKNG